MLNCLVLTNSNFIPQTYSHRVSLLIVPAHLQAIKTLSATRSPDKNLKKQKNKEKHFKLPLKLSGQEKLSR